MSNGKTAGSVLAILTLLALAVWGPILFFRERPAAGSGRERYGEPPGTCRAVSLSELGVGWAGYYPEYQARTASAVSHMVERSA